MKKIIIIFPLLIFLVAPVVYGACTAGHECTNSGSTWTCNYVEADCIQDAVDSATTGDTIVLAETSSPVEWGTGTSNQNFTSAVYSSKGLTIQGAGIGKTTIKLTGNIYALHYGPASEAEYLANSAFRITGITFDLNNTGQGIILQHYSDTYLTKQTNVRIDHCEFKNGASGKKGIQNTGLMGVIDNNVFDGFASSSIFHGNAGVWNGRERWDTWGPITYGASDTMYIEDNEFTNHTSIVLAGQYPTRFSARYNKITTSYMQIMEHHGNQGESAMYASFGGEVYGNDIYATGAGAVGSYYQRAGKLLYYNNSVTSDGTVIAVRPQEEVDDAYNETTTPDIQHVNNSYYFNNWNEYNGSIIGSSQNGNVCSNTIGQAEPECSVETHGYTTVENIAWWQDDRTNCAAEGASCTSGIGCGTLANRPSSCDAGSAYWVPNATIDATAASCSDITNYVGMINSKAISVKGAIGTLYICGASNWTDATTYTPYTYPHPLRGESWASNAHMGLGSGASMSIGSGAVMTLQ